MTPSPRSIRKRAIEVSGAARSGMTRPNRARAAVRRYFAWAICGDSRVAGGRAALSLSVCGSAGAGAASLQSDTRQRASGDRQEHRATDQLREDDQDQQQTGDRQDEGGDEPPEAADAHGQAADR